MVNENLAYRLHRIGQNQTETNGLAKYDIFQTLFLSRKALTKRPIDSSSFASHSSLLSINIHIARNLPISFFLNY